MGWIIFFAVIFGAFYWVYKQFSAADKRPQFTVTVSGRDAWGEADDAEPADDRDNWERFNFYGAELLQAKGRYRINYTDQRGMTTEREIDIKRVYSETGKFAFDALCHLRGAHRSFIDERVNSAVDLDSGEVVSSVAQHAVAQYRDSGAGRAWAAIGREWMAVQILAFVCRADGRMLKAEREVVADYLKRRCADLPHDDEAVDKAIKELGQPDNREFKRIISDMKTAGDTDRLCDILDCAKRIVATQKTVDPMEKAAIELLEMAVA